MKTLKNICDSQLSSMQSDKVILCDYVMTPQGNHLMEESFLATDYKCGYCNGTVGYTPFVDPKVSNKRAWLCKNTDCAVYTKRSRSQDTQTTSQPKRALEWALFCEINTIGDIHHKVRFEDIQQAPAKIEYLLKFAQKPQGIIFMEGDPGTGKTFASMAVCELFTRRNDSCMFVTQKQLLTSWLETFKPESYGSYIQRITLCNLLVIDDFGSGEVSPGFMSFFMDLINSRMQWTDRGTIITTNLDAKTFGLFCGEALADRINTGQKFIFKGKTRRVSIVL